MMTRRDIVCWICVVALTLSLSATGACSGADHGLEAPVLHAPNYQHYFTEFVNNEREMLGTAPPLPWDWFVANIPWIDIPDKEMERIYYFRWYSFQKHIQRGPNGFLISEFLDDVPWSGKRNMIDTAAGHHIREARWLRNHEYVDDYTKFWFGPEGEPRRYSFWAADSIYQSFLATGDRDLAISLLPALVKNYEGWEKTHQDQNGLFWQIDDRDGMEDSISGNGYRPTINSYMYGDAVAISRIAAMAGQTHIAATYQTKSHALRSLIERRLWNPRDNFYETVARKDVDGWTNDRELVGYIPWYFNIPDSQHDAAWKFLFDSEGFQGRYGPTTAERRNPRFNYKVRHECLWNGPSWPFATTQTLVALANLLNGPEQHEMTDRDYFRLLQTYTYSQHIRLPGDKIIPWIDEDLNADTGNWIARSILISLNQPPKNRGRYYNHSGFADLIITGLIGVRPAPGNSFVLHPLLPANKWSFFALDGLPYHGHLLTILYDQDGTRYHRGVGLQVLCDGRQIARADTLRSINVVLPDAEAVTSMHGAASQDTLSAIPPQ
jgi:hypothetical protein